MAPALSASNFSLPLPSWLQPPSSRVAHYDRKRKKTEDWTDDEGDTTDAASVTDSAPPDPPLILTPNESHQYRIAGLSFNQELPSGNFPHGPGYDKDEVTIRGNMPGQLLRSLPYLDIPIYPPQSAAYQGSIRLQHLSVLTAILHRSLLQGDYTRAGRAWGLLLRDEFRGMPMDVRSEGRWGIGAEILLRRGPPEASGDDHHSSLNDLSKRSTTSPFSKKGFAEAKEYYERLILNHPFSKTHPNSISALHFYPAMFGLWVYVTQEESKIARKNLLDREESSEELSDEEDSSMDFERREAAKRHALTATVRAQELDQAQQIATRMDMLLGSPPYADSPQLLELRGMVSLWIGDLIISSLPTPVEDLDYENSPDTMAIDSTPGSLETRRAQRLAMEQKQAEVDKSKEFLEKAKERGRSVAYNLEHFHIHDSSPSMDLMDDA
ncbi:uncharacterized protein N7498_002155 [Penicillium cinerascens]|uniref:Transcription factor domain-containing protein n=1 Tax=Penicillium cinerascens TaxID=70096 RepID=A0A9W9TAL7_9EURO|nr:uncharacterized protein N7498_002155 [Penicillium cinerascens]KAJ5215748.1 hypothetical protein N7498_002155 [Penicillium cinerascens]